MATSMETLRRTGLPRLAALAFALTGTRAAAEELLEASVVKTLACVGGGHSAPDLERRVATQMRHLHLDGASEQARWVSAGRSRRDDAASGARRSATAMWAPPSSEHPLAEPEHQLSEALAEIPPHVRTVVALADVGAVPTATIAREMRLQESVVRDCLARGRRQLAQRLGADAEEPESVAVKATYAVRSRR